jgi:subtilisin family serine protease
MRKTLVIIVTLLFGSASSFFKVTSSSKNTTETTRKHFVLLNEDLSAQQIEKVKSKYGLTKFSKINNQYFNRLFVVDQITNDLQDIAKILPNKKMDVTLSTIDKDQNNTFSTSDDLSGFQYGHFFKDQNFFVEEFDDTIKTKKISASSSINANNRLSHIENNFKRDVVVAVLDTGIDTTHPDINFYRSEDCNEGGAIPIVNPQDTDGNGKAGDCSGWDFTKKKGRLNLPEDDARNGHGTHIAGIISAKKGNGGLSGLSNRIKILPLKVIKRNENLVGSAITFPEIVAKAIEYAIEKNVDVINMSYGWASTVDSEVIREMIKVANEKGIFVVAAAGNDGNNLDFYPCNHRGVICVGSSSPFTYKKNGQNPEISTFSNYGGVVDIFAPGEAILSTFPRSLDSADKVFDQKGYNYASGTSQATPFISLALSVALGLETTEHLSNSANPRAKQLAMKARLIKTSTEVKDDQKWASGGNLNLEKFLDSQDSNYVAPILKNIPVVSINEQKKFEIDIPVENYSKQDIQELNVEIKSQSGEVLFSNSQQKINNFAAGSVENINFSGEVKSLDISFRQVLSISVSSDTFNKSFQKELVFGNAIQDSQTRIIKISEAKDIPFMLQKRRGLYANRINNVADRHRDDVDSNFYFTKIDRRTKEKRLVVVNIEQDKTKTFEYKLPEKVSSAFFNFRKVDLNYDNQKDYLLGLLIEHTDEEKEQGAKDYIEFHYLDSQLKPLYAKHVIEFRPEISAITGFRNINLYPFKRKDGTEMALPIYIFNGGIHDVDLPEKPWLKKKEPFRKIRIYYTELDEANMVFKERVINTYDFEQRLRKNSAALQAPSIAGSSRRARFFENIVPLALGEQNKDLFYRGENKVYLSIGFAAEQETYELTLSKTTPTMIRKLNFNGDANLTRSMLSQHKDPEGMSKDFFNTYLENGNVEFFDPANESIQKYDFRGEDFRGLRASFIKGSETHLLFEFGNHFKLFNQNNTNSFSKYPLGRVSFINGVVFKELTQKIDVLSNGQFEGALYVDSSSITRGNVFALKFIDGKLVPTIRNNLYLKDGCIPMAPVNLEGQTYFASICEEITDRVHANRITGDVHIELSPIH